MDKDNWTTISKSCSTIEGLYGIAVEVAGASVLIGIFEQVLGTIQCGKHELVQCRNHEVHTRPQTDNMIKDEKRQEKNNHKTQNEGNVFLLQGMCCPSGRRRNLVAHFFHSLCFQMVVKIHFFICFQQRWLVAKCTGYFRSGWCRGKTTGEYTL